MSVWGSTQPKASQAVAALEDELLYSLAAATVGGLAFGVLGSSLRSRSLCGAGLSLAVTLPVPPSLAFLRKVVALVALVASLAAFGVVTGTRDVSEEFGSVVPAIHPHVRSASQAISRLDGAPSLALAVACVVAAALASAEIGTCFALGWSTSSAQASKPAPGTRGSDTVVTDATVLASSFESEDSAPLAYTKMKAAMAKSTGDKHGAKVVMYEAMLDVFDLLVDDAVSSLKERHELPKPAVEWLDRMMRYTVPGGKLNRGLAVVHSAATLSRASGRILTKRAHFEARVLGWCVEWLQAFFLVADDLMDSSVTRRGKPCWYRVDGVGVIAINDSLILEQALFLLLERHLSHRPYYHRVMELFHEVTTQTCMGQLLDLTTQPPGAAPDLDKFTTERYKLIVKYKTAFYTFFLPVALGMHMAGVTDAHCFSEARKVCCELGEYFQVQDDFLDCYGDPEVIGKIGTDIQDNKCSWLVVRALARANQKHRRVLEESYGKDNAKDIAKVKALYNELGLREEFERYEAASKVRIEKRIDDLEARGIMDVSVFRQLLAKIFKRSK